VSAGAVVVGIVRRADPPSVAEARAGFLEAVRARFSLRGQWRAAVHLFLADGRELVLAPTRGASKDEFAEACVAIARGAPGVTLAAFASESWAVRTEALHGEEAPADSPFREEILLVQLEQPGGAFEALWIPILREEGRPPRLGEAQAMEPTAFNRFRLFARTDA